MNKRLVLIILSGLLFVSVRSGLAQAASVLVETENFDQSGGWVVDQQFMDHMGSPFLLAHGINRAVADASTTVTFPETGNYRVWVRTRDWTGYWKEPFVTSDSPRYAQGAPGKFLVGVNGQYLETVFGTENAGWHWQDGGMVTINQTEVTLTLHDLTGYEGRCDAILFTTDSELIPPNEDPAMKVWRRSLLGIPEVPVEAGHYDLVVIGGGMAGTCAAISAAREGLAVALIQDRPVLGGNNSSEVRVHLGGTVNHAPYPKIGDIVNELDSGKSGNRGPAENYADDKKLVIVRKESNIDLFLEYRGNEVEMSGSSIVAVIAESTRNGQRLRFTGRTFADCTGDGVIGYLAGADWEMTVTDSSATRMGASNLWRVIDTGAPVAFPHLPWALNLYGKAIPTNDLGNWFWEGGFSHDPFEQEEYIRDWNFRAVYGAWDALKNDRNLHPNSLIEWHAYIAGKRESRRLLGDVILTRDDLFNSVVYPDGCVPTSWSVDLHYANDTYGKNNGLAGDEFISRYIPTNYPRPYWVPYRCLYSRNIANLFMAGRNISVTHEALGTVRVMRTTGMMGEIVGLAAAICKEQDSTPRGVYTDHLSELKRLMGRADEQPPAAPAGLRSLSGEGSVFLEWNANTESDLNSYTVFRSQVSGEGYVQIATVGTNQYTDTSVENGLVYYYVVAAVDSSFNQSGYSEEVRGMPKSILDKIGRNLALDAEITVSSTYLTTYPSVYLNDGDDGLPDFDNKKRWLSSASSIPDYVTLTWPEPRYLSVCRIVSGWNNGNATVDPISEFVLQYYDGQAWIDIPKTETIDNPLTVWTRVFPAVRSDQFRLKVITTPGNISRLWEIEFYHPQADLNQDGVVSLPDLIHFHSGWLMNSESLIADLDFDGTMVNFLDFSILSEFWGW